MEFGSPGSKSVLSRTFPRSRPPRRRHVFFRDSTLAVRETEQDSFALSHGPAPPGAGIWHQGDAGRTPNPLLFVLLFPMEPLSWTTPALLSLSLLSERSHQPPGSRLQPCPSVISRRTAYNPTLFRSLTIHTPSRFRQSYTWRVICSYCLGRMYCCSMASCAM